MTLPKHVYSSFKSSILFALKFIVRTQIRCWVLVFLQCIWHKIFRLKTEGNDFLENIPNYTAVGSMRLCCFSSIRRKYLELSRYGQNTVMEQSSMSFNSVM